jgi:hypothetical protein
MKRLLDYVGAEVGDRNDEWKPVGCESVKHLT